MRDGKGPNGMRDWSVAFNMFGTIHVVARTAEEALTAAEQVLDDELFGFGPDIDGIDYEEPEAYGSGR